MELADPSPGAWSREKWQNEGGLWVQMPSLGRLAVGLSGDPMSA